MPPTPTELDPVLSVRDKSFPPSSWGQALSEFLAGGPRVSDLAMPLLTLDATALAHNTRIMQRWVADQGLQLAPHGKTTMSPKLWGRFDGWGLTLATAWQAQVARAAGIRRIMIANAVVDPVGLRWLAEQAADPEAEVSCWADSLETVHVMEAVLAGAGASSPIPVIVELGADGGRTGARTRAAALTVAQAVDRSPWLQVAGVGGYEGALAHGRGEEAIARVDAYLDEVAAVHREVADAGLLRAGARPVVTAGGSAYFDRVAARLGHLTAEADVVLRSGAFQIHDDGLYAGISPMGREVGDEPFRAAMHLWSRVVSHPERRLSLLDAGRRDASFDNGMPVPQRRQGEAPSLPAGLAVTSLNDQHAFLRLPDDSPDETPEVGAVLRLGLSHPCTVLDKWRLIPVVADSDHPDPVIVDAVPTCF